MSASFAILAQPLAPDCIGLALLFLIVLAFLHGVSSWENRPIEWRSTWHRLHQVRHGLHELISHRHH